LIPAGACARPSMRPGQAGPDATDATRRWRAKQAPGGGRWDLQAHRGQRGFRGAAQAGVTQPEAQTVASLHSRAAQVARIERFAKPHRVSAGMKVKICGLIRRAIRDAWSARISAPWAIMRSPRRGGRGLEFVPSSVLPIPDEERGERRSEEDRAKQVDHEHERQ